MDKRILSRVSVRGPGGRSKEERSLRLEHKKKCSRCKEIKSLDDFYRRGDSGGWKYQCKSCQAETYTNRKYGVSLQDLSPFCEICGASDCRLAVDHDHATGTVRGRLCHFCNRALGFSKTVPSFYKKRRTIC